MDKIDYIAHISAESGLKIDKDSIGVYTVNYIKFWNYLTWEEFHNILSERNHYIVRYNIEDKGTKKTVASWGILNSIQGCINNYLNNYFPEVDYLFMQKVLGIEPAKPYEEFVNLLSNEFVVAVLISRANAI